MNGNKQKVFTLCRPAFALAILINTGSWPSTADGIGFPSAGPSSYCFSSNSFSVEALSLFDRAAFEKVDPSQRPVTAELRRLISGAQEEIERKKKERAKLAIVLFRAQGELKKAESRLQAMQSELSTPLGQLNALSIERAAISVEIVALIASSKIFEEAADLKTAESLKQDVAERNLQLETIDLAIVETENATQSIKPVEDTVAKSQQAFLEAKLAVERVSQEIALLETGGDVQLLPIPAVAPTSPTLPSPSETELLHFETEMPWIAKKGGRIKRQLHHLYVMWRLRMLGMPDNTLATGAGRWAAWTKDRQVLESTIEFLQANLSDYEEHLKTNHLIFNANLENTLKPAVKILRYMKQDLNAKVLGTEILDLRDHVKADNRHGRKKIDLWLLNEIIGIAADHPPVSIAELIALYHRLQEQAGKADLSEMFSMPDNRNNTLALIQELYEHPDRNKREVPQADRRKRRTSTDPKEDKAVMNLDAIREALPGISDTVQRILAQIHETRSVRPTLLKREADNLSKLENLGMEPDTLAMAAGWIGLRTALEDLNERAKLLEGAVVDFKTYIKSNYALMKFDLDNLSSAIALLRPLFDGTGGAVIPADVLLRLASQSQEDREKLTNSELRKLVASVAASRSLKGRAQVKDNQSLLEEAQRQYDSADHWRAQGVLLAADSSQTKRALAQYREAKKIAGSVPETLAPLLEEGLKSPMRIQAVALQKRVEELNRLLENHLHVLEMLHALEAAGDLSVSDLSERVQNIRDSLLKGEIIQELGLVFLEDLSTHMSRRMKVETAIRQFAENSKTGVSHFLRDAVDAVRILLVDDVLAQELGRRLMGPIQKQIQASTSWASEFKTLLFPEDRPTESLGKAQQTGASSHALVLVLQDILRDIPLLQAPIVSSIAEEEEEDVVVYNPKALSGRSLYNSYLRTLELPEDELYVTRVIMDQRQRLARQIENALEDPESELDAEAKKQLRDRLVPIAIATSYLSNGINYSSTREELIAEGKSIHDRKSLEALRKSRQTPVVESESQVNDRRGRQSA